jgi:hypothetical protein
VTSEGAVQKWPRYKPVSNTPTLWSAVRRDELVTFTFLKECMDAAPYTSDVEMQDQNTHMSGKAGSMPEHPVCVMRLHPHVPETCLLMYHKCTALMSTCLVGF